MIGFCPVCGKWTIFWKLGPWLRDQYICVLCRSIPRHRAFMNVLGTVVPDWRRLTIHESSPCGAVSKKLARDCLKMTFSCYFPNVPAGSYKGGMRCENLEQMSFADQSFDIFVTQDVFEHIFEPDRAFKEIARVLRPGGIHIFTVPYYANQPTAVRAARAANGITHLLPETYHKDPTTPKGCLVTRDWGSDITSIIEAASGMSTTIYAGAEKRLGIEGEFLEVFVSRKKG